MICYSVTEITGADIQAALLSSGEQNPPDEPGPLYVSTTACCQIITERISFRLRT